MEALQASLIRQAMCLEGVNANTSIPKKQRLEPSAHISFLVGYNSINIYRIWVPSQQKVIRTKNFIFNKFKFYNPSEFNAAHRYNISELVEAIEFTYKAPFYHPQEADNNNWEFFKEQLLQAVYEICDVSAR